MQVTAEPRAEDRLQLEPRRDRRPLLIAASALLGAVCLLGIQFWGAPPGASSAVHASRMEAVAALGRLLPGLNHGNLSAPVSGPGLAELDRQVREVVLSDTFVRVKIWNPNGQVVYSDDRTLIGQSFKIGHELEEALTGTVAVEAMETTRIVDASPDRTQRLHEVYIPIVLAGETSPSGAFEVYAYVDEDAGRWPGWALAAALGLIGAAALSWQRGRSRT